MLRPDAIDVKLKKHLELFAETTLLFQIPRFFFVLIVRRKKLNSIKV